MQITVTEEHIKEASDGCGSHDCPLALAFLAAGFESVSIGLDPDCESYTLSAFFKGRYFDCVRLSALVSTWIRDFDNGRKVKSIKFEFEI